MRRLLLTLCLLLLGVAAGAQDYIRFYPPQLGTTSNGAFTLSGPLLLPDGTAAAPSLAFASATTTGFSHPSGTIVDFSSGGTAAIRFQGNGTVLPAGYFLAWNVGAIGTTQDTFLSRAAAATIQQGGADAAAPVNQTLQAQGVAAGTSDVSGANYTITSGNGRGNATGSSLIFQTPTAVGSGSGAQTMTARLTLNSASGAVASSLGNQAAALTAATMTSSTGYRVTTATSSFDWTNAQVAALAGSSGDITVATLPAKTQLLDAAVVILTPDSSANALTVQCGDAATFINYVVASDAKAAANTFYGDALAERGTAIDVEHYYLPSYTATTTVTCRFIKAVTNLNTVTASTGRVILTTRLLP